MGVIKPPPYPEPTFEYTKMTEYLLDTSRTLPFVLHLFQFLSIIFIFAEKTQLLFIVLSFIFPFILLSYKDQFDFTATWKLEDMFQSLIVIMQIFFLVAIHENPYNMIYYSLMGMIGLINTGLFIHIGRFNKQETNISGILSMLLATISIMIVVYADFGRKNYWPDDVRKEERIFDRNYIPIIPRRVFNAILEAATKENKKEEKMHEEEEVLNKGYIIII